MKDRQNKPYLKLVEDDLKAQLRSKEFWSCNAFEVTVGTNTPCGGDAGHGGKTLLKLRDLAGTEWAIAVDGKEVAFCPRELVIVLGGDSEAKTFADSLIFAGRTLKKQMRETLWGELCSRVFALEHKLETKEQGI